MRNKGTLKFTDRTLTSPQQIYYLTEKLPLYVQVNRRYYGQFHVATYFSVNNEN